MSELRYSSLEELHYHIVMDLIHDSCQESAPRGQRIKEKLATTLVLTNPRDRIIRSPARNANYGFGVGEFCWYMRGDNDLETMRYYNKRMDMFSDDGETLRSSYGARMFRHRDEWHHDNVSQWDLVREELIRDPDSRRAILHINEPKDLLAASGPGGSKDVPCTLSLQLFIRDRKLHMHTTMRSNDVIWGLPYDVFSFTLLQEFMMLSLKDDGAPVDDIGSYYHTVGSIHLYERHWEMARRLRSEYFSAIVPFPGDRKDDVGSVMEPMDLLYVKRFIFNVEPDLRRSAIVHNEVRPGCFEWMHEQLVAHRLKRDAEGPGKDERKWSE